MVGASLVCCHIISDRTIRHRAVCHRPHHHNPQGMFRRLLAVLLVCGSSSWAAALRARFHHVPLTSASSRAVLPPSRRSVACFATLSDSRELTKLFGRMSDKMLLLDVPGAGTPEMMNCCHGGCDNCDFSHVFDNLTAGRPKWVPLYAYRKLIDGRDHTSPWAGIFTDGTDGGVVDGGHSVDEATFIARVQALPYRMTMGPGESVPADEVPDEEALRDLWRRMGTALDALGEAGGDGPGSRSTITADQMAKALTQLMGESHGVMWMDFKRKLMT